MITCLDSIADLLFQKTFFGGSKKDRIQASENLTMDNLIKYWLFLLVKAMITCLDLIADLLFGTTLFEGNKRDRIQASESYELSAQLVHILWKQKEDFLTSTRLHHFLYKHEAYVNPNYILKNKNISLMAIEKDYAIFCVTDPSVDIFDTEKFPFTMFAHWELSKKLVILPIASFHRLADELGDPKVPVIAAAMTARCGSTLLVQLFNKVPNTRAMSEPNATCDIHGLRGSGKITPEESVRLLRSALRLLCKVEPGTDIERIFIKMAIDNAPQLGDIAILFPNFAYLFNTRHPVPSIRSIKTVLEDNFGGLYHKLGIFWRGFAGRGFAFAYHGGHDKVIKRYSTWRKNISDAEFGMVLYAASLASFFDNKSMFRRVVFYENLSDDPEDEVEKIFEKAGIPLEHVPTALEALKHDSQKGTLGTRGKARSSTIQDDVLKTFDGLMEDMNLPQVKHMMSVEEFKAAF